PNDSLANGPGTGTKSPTAPNGEALVPSASVPSGEPGRRQPSPPGNGQRRPLIGRPATNQDVVDFVLDQKQREPVLRNKQILKRFRDQHPDHPIFKTKNPQAALRAALLRTKDTSER